MATKRVETIELKSLDIKTAQITIVGDGDLVLNKMNDVVSRTLIDTRKNKAKNVTEKPNEWEEIITSMHWRDGKPTDFTQKGLMDALKKNAPCLTAFGLKKSFGQAVVQNGIDKYSTKFNAGMNIVATGNLVPIQFAQHYVDEKLMSPKKGSPVLVRLNRFSGWKATFVIQYTGAVYSLEQIINIINMSGFSIGIGSGRTSGYGRYHVDNVEAI